MRSYPDLVHSNVGVDRQQKIQCKRGDSSIVTNGNGEDKHGFHGVMRQWAGVGIHVLDPLRDSSLMLRPRSGSYKT
jgi:hypothetical protein